MVGGHLFHAICRQPQQDNGHLCGHFSALDRGVWRAWPRGPYARGPPAQRTPQFAWERFPVDILFAPRLFSPFRFSFCPLCPTSPFFSELSPLRGSPSNLRSSASFAPPPPLAFAVPSPESGVFFFFFLYPHPIHTRAFTFDESRWNYPLHSRGQWGSFSGVKG